MKKSFFLTICILATLYACKTNNYLINVEPISTVKTLKTNPLLYALPKAVIVINIQAIKTTHLQGPFYNYAAKYLGLTNVITQNSEDWSMGKISIQNFSVVDTNNIYVIENMNPAFPIQLSISPEGFIAGINSEITYQAELLTIQKTNIPQLKNINLDYGNVSVKNNFAEITDTLIHEIYQDSVFFKFPVTKKEIVNKKPEEQAAELADLIIRIRDDRNALLVGEGDNDYLPDGEALKTMLQGLDNQEKEYLALFTGITINETYNYYFEFTPEANKNNSQNILFRFSTELGILPRTNTGGQPVFITINSFKTTETLKNFVNNQAVLQKIAKKGNMPKGIIYRMPASANIVITKGNDVLAGKTMLIPQLGENLILPAAIFNNPEIKVEFYPETGALKSLKNK